MGSVYTVLKVFITYIHKIQQIVQLGSEKWPVDAYGFVISYHPAKIYLYIGNYILITCISVWYKLTLNMYDVAL